MARWLVREERAGHGGGRDGDRNGKRKRSGGWLRTRQRLQRRLHLPDGLGEPVRVVRVERVGEQRRAAPHSELPLLLCTEEALFSGGLRGAEKLLWGEIGRARVIS